MDIDNWTVRRGDPFSATYAFGPVDAPEDVSGLTFVAQVRRTYDSETVMATPTVDMTRAAQGEITLSLTGAQTSAMTDGMWDVERRLNGVNQGTDVGGAVTIVPDVTR